MPYSAFSLTNITHIDAALYTNHTMAMYTKNWGQDLVLNGCIVSRNEAIVYGTRTLTMNHDLRLLGGGENFDFYLPKVWDTARIIMWSSD